MPDDDAPVDLDDFDPALHWFLQRVPMTTHAMARLAENAKQKAFWVSNVQKAKMIQHAYDAITDAIRDGTDFEEFKQEMADELYSAWGGEEPYRLETIFRTNLQSAFSAGRWFQSEEPLIRRLRPYKQFSAVLDGRTSPICAALNGIVRPADDPFWDTHNPPLHHNCRSTIISLDKEEAEEAGLTEKVDDLPEAAEGFGTPPKLIEWDPDIGSIPPEIAQQLPGR